MTDALRAVAEEQAVIGAALLEVSAADECLPLLRPEAFSRLPHERIWGAIGRLRAEGKGCDVLSVATALEGQAESVGGIAYLSDLTAAVPAIASARAYAGRVHEAHVRRQIVRAAREAIAAAEDPSQDAQALVGSVDRQMRSVTEAATWGDEPRPLPDLLAEAFSYVEALYEGTRQPGIGTGIPLLDRHLGGGLHPGELCILGAQPSAGKSALAESMALHIASRSRSVLYATPEMTELMVALRALAYAAGVDLRKLQGSPRMDGDDWTALSRALGTLAERTGRLWVDGHVTTWDGIAAKARRLHSVHGLDLLVVDHLHELEWPTGADSENRAISEIGGGVKRRATAVGGAAPLRSMLTRAARSYMGAPRAHDLRGSGSIEQHADTILLLYPKDDSEGSPREITVDVIVEKQRNGATGIVGLSHDRATGRFRDPREGRDHPVLGGGAA